MVSNTCKLERGGSNLAAILTETDKVAVYNELSHKEALRLHLLAEELSGMARELVKNYRGTFHIVTDDKAYELCLSLETSEMNSELRKELIAVSKNKKNAAAVGITGKIRAAFDHMAFGADAMGSMIPPIGYCENPETIIGTSNYMALWSLERYKAEVDTEKDREKWDELEKSLLAKLADDVVVGVKGRCVDIIVKKVFA